MRVVGLDPSLASFGAAAVDTESGILHLWTWRYPKLRGHARLDRLIGQVNSVVGSADLVIIEGLSYNSQGGMAYDRAGLHWLVRQDLYRLGLPYGVIPPAVRAKWLTGKGNANKDTCLAAAIKRFWTLPVVIEGNDQADALTLAAMGCAKAGHAIVEMPADRAPLLASGKCLWFQSNGEQHP